jgi:predicted nucleic acid-binding protein
LRVYLDTNVVIRGMERTDTGASDVGRLLDLAQRRRLELVTSELTLCEVLVGPLKASDDLLVQSYLGLFAEDALVQVSPVTREVLVEAARIRARSTATLADAIHAAAAVLSRCDAVVSYDRRLGEFASLKVLVPAAPIFDDLDTAT